MLKVNLLIYGHAMLVKGFLFALKDVGVAYKNDVNFNFLISRNEIFEPFFLSSMLRITQT